MSDKVKNGTPEFGPSLCETCINGHVERGYRENECAVFCEATYFGHPVLFPVRECSSYAEKKRAKLREMEKIALMVGGTGKRVDGFGVTEEEKAADEEIQLVLTQSKWN